MSGNKINTNNSVRVAPKVDQYETVFLTDEERAKLIAEGKYKSAPPRSTFGDKDDTGGDTSDRGHNMTELRRQRRGKAI